MKYLVEGAEGSTSVIPLGMADMEFETAACVVDALRHRLDHPSLGYTAAAASSRRIVAAWYARRWEAAVDPDWVVLMPVNPKAALALLLRAVRRLRGGAQAHLLDVEYPGISKVAAATGHQVRRWPNASSDWSRPVGLLNATLNGGDVTIFSNPHNPTGNVWSVADIKTMSQRVANTGGLLISDEVHAALTLDGSRHPVAAVVAGDNRDSVVTLGSVGKAFNCSGIAGSYLIVPDEHLREAVNAVLDDSGMYQGGMLSMVAQDAALSLGDEWLDAVAEKLRENRDHVREALSAQVPEIARSIPGASFLYWLNFTQLSIPPETLHADVLTSTGLYLMDGRRFGPAGEAHLRLNFATDEATVKLIASRLSEYVISRL